MALGNNSDGWWVGGPFCWLWGPLWVLLGGKFPEPGSQAFLGSQSLWGARVDVEEWQGEGHIGADTATGGDI